MLEARGNRDPMFAPQGCYPAAGDDRWLALTVRDDAAWPKLCYLIGRRRPGGRSAGWRRWPAGERAMTSSTLPSRPGPATGRHGDGRALQAAGIAATPTLTAADVVADPHLAARSFVSEVERLDGGTRYTLGVPWMIDGQRPDGFRRAPRVGEDNEYVFKTLLGLPSIRVR